MRAFLREREETTMLYTATPLPRRKQKTLTLQTAFAVRTLGLTSTSPVFSYSLCIVLRICSARLAAPFSPDLAQASMTDVYVLVLGFKSG